MARIIVRRWFLFLLPVLAGCGITDLLEPGAGEDETEPVIEDFEDGVASVDLIDNSVTLNDGTVVRVVDGTERKTDEQGRVVELVSAHAALEAEHAVHAWGRGEVHQEDPLVLDATELGLSIAWPVEEFEGEVSSADLDGHSFHLTSDVLVQMGEHTELLPDQAGVSRDLAAVREALEAGHRVFAWGAAEVESDAPLKLVALRVGFRVEEAPLQSFEGEVVQVWLDLGKFQIADGPLVYVGDHTEMASPEGVAVSLAEMHEALQAGSSVFAWGAGRVEHHSGQLVGVEVIVRIESGQPDPDPQPDPNLDPFDAPVEFADMGSIFLLDGTEVVLQPNTVISGGNEFSPTSMDELMVALEAGRQVVARGGGDADPANPSRILAVEVVLEAVLADFADDVSMVDPGGGLILMNGSFVLVTADTQLLAAGPDDPATLADVDAAVGAGQRVRASGFGYVMGFPGPGEPVSVEALQVTFESFPN